MRTKPVVSLFILAVLSVFSLPAFGQGGHSDISADFTGNFQKEATGLGTTDSASYSGGLLANYRFHFNDWNGIEANYAYTKFSQYYTPGFTAQAQANEFTVAYVNNLGRPAKAKIRPFVEAGTGLLIFSPVPAGSTTNGTRQDRAVFLFGGGVDWHIKRNISVRLGFRDLIYTAPDFAVGVQVTKAATQMPEPYAGIAFRF